MNSAELVQLPLIDGAVVGACACMRSLGEVAHPHGLFVHRGNIPIQMAHAEVAVEVAGARL